MHNNEARWGCAMDTSLYNLLEFLNFGEENPLFAQREQGKLRTLFQLEKQLFSFIAEGQPDEMLAYYESLLESQPNLQIQVGELSRDKLRQFKYAAVSLIAIVCRIALYNGAPEAIAYGMSDQAIQEIDKLADPESILLFEIAKVYEYAQLVADHKKNTSFSSAIRSCIEFITTNLHSNISLEDLARGTTYNKEYIAKLFKKEVGITVSEYILKQRIAEAQKLLLKGMSSREIAYTLRFSSQSHFIRQFKKVAGITPKEYQELHLSSGIGIEKGEEQSAE